MNTCFNCGIRYYQSDQDPQDGFCSNKCKDEDDARLVEGNGIIAAAEQAEHGFTDINKLKLDIHAPAAAQAVKNLLGFNRHANLSERSDHSTHKDVNQNTYNGGNHNNDDDAA